MPRRIVTLSLVLGAFVLGLMLDQANAAVASSNLAKAGKLMSGSTEVRWVCTPYRCVWTPNYYGVVPPYARRWGPPRRAGCFWERRRGRWIQVCRRYY